MNEQVLNQNILRTGYNSFKRSKIVKKSVRLNIERATSNEELVDFQKSTYRQLGIEFPLDFLINSKVFIVRDNNNSICGGFALCEGLYSRVIKSLPQVAYDRLEEIEALHHRKVFEITALWLDRSVRTKVGPFVFWTKLYKEVIKMKAPYFIYAYSSEKKKLGELYSIAKPIKLFEGYTKILPGMSCADHEVVEIAKVSNLHKAWVTNFSCVFKRLVKKRSSQRRKIYH